MTAPQDVPVFVLCGGMGTRFREQTEFRPKPMIAVGNHPILWHIMRFYAANGFRRFVLCLGYRAEAIKEYFLHYTSLNSDFTVDLASNAVTVHSIDHTDNWTVTLAYTGESTMTGARVARAAKRYLGTAQHFAVTYGDGLTNASIADELRFHVSHGRLGTVLGVNPPSRFGQIKVSGNEVTAFEEKPEFGDNWINGGYFLFRKEFLDYLSNDEACVLEREPLVRLARERQLAMFEHHGFWQCMDTQRDHDLLSRLWDSGEAPWVV